jgi:small subunit ribosomal protein S8
MLTRIRNAGLARLERVEIPSSKIKIKIAEILKQEGFVLDVETIKDDRQGKIFIDLRYDDKRRLAIQELKRLSKPGRRVYASCDEIPRIRNGLGVCIVSTSMGVMTDRDARRKRVGGELVCSVW